MTYPRVIRWVGPIFSSKGPGTSAKYPQVSALAMALVLGLASPSQAGDIGSFIGGVVGGIIGQTPQPAPQPQPNYYQQQQYQQQQNAAAEAARRQAEIKRQKALQAAQEKKQQEAAAAAGTAAVGSGPIDVPMKRKDGNLWVSAQINNVVTIDFVVDSGASDITLPKDVYQTLIRSGTLTKANYISTTQFSIGDGSQVAGLKFKLASLQVGDQVLKDVVASVMPSDSATPLLGLSFLSRFQAWTIDNNAGTLKLTPLPGSEPNKSDSTQVAAQPPQPQAAPTIAPLPEPSVPNQSPTLKVASADGPRSGHVANSALIVTDQTTSPAAAPDTTTPETAAASVPTFPSNTPYEKARTSLMALGYGPAPLPNAGKCDADTDTTCFPERAACTKADGIHCDYLWRRGEQVIKVTTAAVPPTVSTIECQVNCK
jgi:clan AA aspartic protease (TIGR02281 family)